jgi:hypothetical protein
VRRDRQRRVGVVLIATVVTLGGGGLLYAGLGGERSVARDAADCPREAKRIGRRTLVLMDRTDPLTGEQRERLAALVADLDAAMAVDERLAIHAFGERAETAAEPWVPPGAVRGFDRCRAVRSAALANALLESPGRLAAEHARRFGRPLQAVVEALATGGGATRSPILEAIEAAFWSPALRGGGPRRLLIVSDLLQHGSGHSQIDGRRPELCALLASPFGARLAALDWKEVEVTLVYLRRAGQTDRQGAAHLAWWGELFHRLGAARVVEAGGPDLRPPLAACMPARESRAPSRARKAR